MVDLPNGTVTFLFTDIQNSTALWERHPTGMRVALSRHNILLHEAITQHGGQVFKTVGDAFCAAFSVATDGLAAALAAQRALRAESWGEVGTLGVRMALHTGAPEVDGDDYMGPPLNRVARVLGLADGGQIILSRATAELVCDRLPADVRLVDLGVHPLRGLRRPEHVFQLLSAGPSTEISPSGFVDAQANTPLTSVTAGAAEPATVHGAILRVSCLGRFRVAFGDDELPDGAWSRHKARQLFKCLLTRPQRRLTREEAFELFWPDSDPDAANSTLRATLNAIRVAFRKIGAASVADCVVMDHGTICISLDARMVIDTDIFEQLIARARQADDPVPSLEEADATYAGTFLPDDIHEEWTGERRRALERQWADLQRALAQHREQRGDWEGAAAALERLIVADDCDEQAAKELMRLLARHGRRTQAVRVYDRLVESLGRIETTPSDDLRELRQQIATGRPSTTDETGGTSRHVPHGAASHRPPGTVTALTSPAQRRADGMPGPPRYTPAYPFPSPGRLIGRARELATLEQALGRALTACQIVFLSAPAGTGKSTIAGALMQRASRSGVLCLAGGGYEQQGVVPLGPVRDALADYLLTLPPDSVRSDLGAAAPDLVEIVPELRAHLALSDVTSGHPPAQDRLFGAVHTCLRALAGRAPIFLCLEDLHAADAATFDLIRFLSRRARRLPLFVLGTFRSDEVRPGQPLAQLTAALAREGAEQISLPPLGREDTGRMGDALLEGATSDRLRAVLHEVTEGNPLFIEQLILALRDEGRIDSRNGVWHFDGAIGHELPSVVQGVITGRFERLSGRCRDILAMGSVLGRSIEHAVLAAALDDADESTLLHDLEEALDAQLLRETPDGYTFAHGLLREALYWSISARRRMLFHRRAGNAMERLAGTQANERASELAHHFIRAGDSDEAVGKALRYSLEAGRRATSLSSHREALQHFSQAHEIVERIGDAVDPSLGLEALQGRGLAERSLAMWTDCLATFQRILTLTENPLIRASARSSLSRAKLQRGETLEALSETERSLTELGPHDTAETARLRIQLLYDKAYIRHLQGRFGETLEMGQQMLEVAERQGLGDSVFLPHVTLALAYKWGSQVDLAVAHYAQAIAITEAVGDRTWTAVCHENTGLSHYRGGRFSAAVTCLERAIEIYRDTVTELRAVNAMRVLGLALLADGDDRRAEGWGRTAGALASDGQDRWAVYCFDLLGAVHAYRGELDQAEQMFTRAHAIHEQLNHPTYFVDSLLGLGRVYEQRGDWSQAIDVYRRALDIAGALDSCQEQVAARRHLGRLLLRQGDESSARILLTEALSQVETMQPCLEYGPTYLAVAEISDRGDVSQKLERAVAVGGTVEHRVDAHVAAAGWWINEGQTTMAGPHVTEATRLAEHAEASRLRGQALQIAARLALAEGMVDLAERTLASARGELTQADAPYDLAVALREYAHTLGTKATDRSRARTLHEEALQHFERLGATPDAARQIASRGDLRSQVL